jgi:hypothetical protein
VPAGDAACTQAAPPPKKITRARKTADLLTQRLAVHEQKAWLLNSLLEQ